MQNNQLKFSSGWFQAISPFPFPGIKLLSPAVERAGLVSNYPIAEAEKTITAAHCANIFLYYQVPDADFWDSHCISDARFSLHCVALDSTPSSGKKQAAF